MQFKSPEILIAALLKNELTVEDLQIAFRYFAPRDRLNILEKLDDIVTKGSNAANAEPRPFRGRAKT
jgi:hypothetical protein